jgi:ABC-type transport system substrate-binding protein
MDRLIEQGMVETNDARRKEIFSKVQKLAAEDLPYVNLWYWNNTLVGPSQMRDVVVYPNGNYLTLAQLRIEE